MMRRVTMVLEIRSPGHFPIYLEVIQITQLQQKSCCSDRQVYVMDMH